MREGYWYLVGDGVLLAWTLLQDGSQRREGSGGVPLGPDLSETIRDLKLDRSVDVLHVFLLEDKKGETVRKNEGCLWSWFRSQVLSQVLVQVLSQVLVQVLSQVLSQV